MISFIERYTFLKLTQEEAETQRDQYPKNSFVKTPEE